MGSTDELKQKTLRRKKPAIPQTSSRIIVHDKQYQNKPTKSINCASSDDLIEKNGGNCDVLNLDETDAFSDASSLDSSSIFERVLTWRQRRMQTLEEDGETDTKQTVKDMTRSAIEQTQEDLQVILENEHAYRERLEEYLVDKEICSERKKQLLYKKYKEKNHELIQRKLKKVVSEGGCQKSLENKRALYDKYLAFVGRSDRPGVFLDMVHEDEYNPYSTAKNNGRRVHFLEDQ